MPAASGPANDWPTKANKNTKLTNFIFFFNFSKTAALQVIYENWEETVSRSVEEFFVLRCSKANWRCNRNTKWPKRQHICPLFSRWFACFLCVRTHIAGLLGVRCIGVAIHEYVCMCMYYVCQLWIEVVKQQAKEKDASINKSKNKQIIFVRNSLFNREVVRAWHRSEFSIDQQTGTHRKINDKQLLLFIEKLGD